MRSRAVRLSLLLLAAVSVLAAAFLFWNIDRRAQTTVDATRSLDTRLASAIRQTFDLRSAQQAYVSHGQQAQFWIAKVTAATGAVRESLTAVQSAITATSSRVAIEGALQALQEFERMDRRAREYATASQKLLASDLIFSDGLETTEEIITALEQTRHVEAADAETARAGARRDQVKVASTAALIALVVLILLTPAPPADEAMAASGAAFGRHDEGEAHRRPETPATIAEEAEAFEFRPLVRPPTSARVLETNPVDPGPPPVEPEQVPAIAAPAIVAASNTAASTAVPVLDLAPDIEAVAEVCKELARLADTAALPSLLRRAATALDASGVMVWVADPEARELTAIASHGYPPNILSRIGTIPKDAENVTAAAFRTGLLQTLRADADSPGAIAAPLVNPSGCLGVMSAEVQHDGEQQPARLALATIVAAQLATLVAPATRARSKSEAV